MSGLSKTLLLALFMLASFGLARGGEDSPSAATVPS